MASTEKEFNGNLFDQLSILERVEEALEKGGKEAAMEAIERERKQINRKLYQTPPLTEEN